MIDDNHPESVNFDREADFYDDTRGFPPGVGQKAAELIAQAGQIMPSSRVIEIGIGTGRIAIPLSQYAKTIHGVDVSSKMIEVLTKKLHGEAVYPSQADAGKLPYADNTFDAAVIVHVLHLVANLPNVVSELKRVLKPTARLVHCFNRDDKSFRELIESWREALGYDVVKRWGHVDRALPDAGWNQIGDHRSFDYTKQNSPDELLELYRRRIWSATWELSDEQLAHGLALMQEHIYTHYQQPTQPITVAHTFHATVFQPPES